MIPIEAGSPFTPIGDNPNKSGNAMIVLISLALLATAIIAIQPPSLITASKKSN
jgi:hypothetical protein